MLAHGWPDSFYRLHKVVPMLADPARYGGDPADSFDVVVPSLPGFGFSDRPTGRGTSYSRVAELWGRLMTEVLGYGRFAAHGGGDVGRRVTHRLALDRPDALVGIHLTNAPHVDPAAFADDAPELSEAERGYVKRVRRWVREEGAYAAVQSTRPQTLAFGLNDSPGEAGGLDPGEVPRLERR